MKQLKNQNGYALVIVLLIIVLFMGVAASFIGGSLSNAKQEQTVDTSDQSVAAAEMGVLFYTSDFEMDLEQIKKEVSAKTQEELNKLISCIEPPTLDNCNTAEKRSEWENRIDKDMKTLYIDKIKFQIDNLKTISINPAGNTKKPFDTEQISYVVKTVKHSPISYTIDKIDVEILIEGTSKNAEKVLTTKFDIEVPDSFLNSDEAIKIDTVLIEKNADVTYEDIFKLAPTDKSCTTLLNEVIAKTATAPFECKAKTGEKLSVFINEIENANLDPKDFRVYTSSFTNYVCDSNCNNLDFQGINVVVEEKDEGAFNNMNNLVNGNLIINGKLTAGNNLMNLGKNGIKQNIIVKELDVGNNIKNMYYTNFLVLGHQNRTDARLEWGNHFEVSNYSRLCIDIDRILQSDLDRLSKEVSFSNSGSLIYYSADPKKTFSLVDNNKKDRNTAVHVQRGETYTTFLENCGVTLKNTQTVPTEVAVPNVIDSDFEFEVNY